MSKRRETVRGLSNRWDLQRHGWPHTNSPGKGSYAPKDLSDLHQCQIPSLPQRKDFREDTVELRSILTGEDSPVEPCDSIPAQTTDSRSVRCLLNFYISMIL